MTTVPSKMPLAAAQTNVLAVFGFTSGKCNDDSKEFKTILGFDIIIVSAEAGEVKMPDAVSMKTGRAR